VTRNRLAVLAFSVLAVAGSSFAGESEMLGPLPGLNVWSGGKTSFTLWGGIGKTSIGDRSQTLVTDEYGYPVLGPADAYVLFDKDSGEYDDRDWSAGGRFAFPVANNVTIEVGAHYLSGKTDTDPYHRDFQNRDRQPFRVNVLYDELKTTDYGVSATALYSLASGAASPIRGGLYGGVEFSKTKVEQEYSLVGQSYDYNADVPTFGLDDPLAFEGNAWNATNVVVRVGLTGDIHIIPETLRITPTFGYYYAFTSLKDSYGVYYDTASGNLDVSSVELEDDENGGGPSYGIELGYRPGGENGKFEIVFTPVFKGRHVQTAGPRDQHYSRESMSGKLDDHRNAYILQFRMFL
jgi:hypothetical protein